MSNDDEKNSITLPAAVAVGADVIIGAAPTIAAAQVCHLWQPKA
ncbi:MAG: hypothetical protein Q8S27_06575 [Hoeflea sp.]|nr:hypothetical protein [Hoeflea sp.]